MNEFKEFAKKMVEGIAKDEGVELDEKYIDACGKIMEEDDKIWNPLCAKASELVDIGERLQKAQKE